MEAYKKQLCIVKKKIATKWEKSKPIIVKGIKISGVIGAGALIVTMNKLFQISSDDFENWLETASDEELSDGYEERRLKWLKDNHGDITPEMSKINDEIVSRMNKKYEKEHPNTEARHREHGWYLSNDN